MKIAALFLCLLCVASAQEQPPAPVLIEFAYTLEQQVQAFVLGMAACLPLMVPMLLIHYSRKAASTGVGTP